MKLLTQIARIVAGLIFVFSGFVKGIDPLGTAFKLGDYFAAFRLGFMDELSLPLSVVLSLVEFITGMMLLSGSLIRIASWMALIFMVFFTPLTLILAIYNPVSDCGCFGDAIVLSNWQTFFKNLVITIPVLFLFFRRDDDNGAMSFKHGLNFSVASIFLFLLFMRMNLAYLPIIDFRPYKIGTNIAEGMEVPPDAEPDRYDIRLIYEKNGEQQEFTLNNYPAEDTSWTFVDQKSVLISRGYVPPIHGFTLVDEYGTEMTDEVIRHPGDVVLMVARRLDKSDRKGLSKGYDLGIKLHSEGIAFHIITATSPAEAEPLTTGFSALFADEITLKTIIRSDPGFVLLHNGTVAAKWSYHNLPDTAMFTGDLNTLALQSATAARNRVVTTAALLSVIILLTISHPFRRKA